MEAIAARRNTWVACPNCGKKVAKVRTCDMEVRCKNCGHEFEAVIASARAESLKEPSKE